METSISYQADQYIQNLAEGVMTSNSVDAISNSLVAIYGTGLEKNNRQAIQFWVDKTIEEIPACLDNPLPVLNDYFRQRLEEIIELNS